MTSHTSDGTADPTGQRTRMPIWMPSGIGLLLAGGFFLLSVTPSLMPRDPVPQGVLSGLSMGVGYCVGAVLQWIWRVMLLTRPGTRGAWAAHLLGALGGLALMIYGLWQALPLMNAARTSIGVPPVETSAPFLIGGLAAIVFFLLWAVGTLFVVVARRAGRALSRVLPGRVGPVLGVMLAAWLLWALIDGVLVRRAMEAADASFAAAELVFDPGQEPPSDPTMTGGADSLVTWAQLGNRGRDFVARTPDPAEIAAYTGEPALRPVRVYVGRVSAATAQARAELALAELIRQDAFSRKLLIVTTPVGTGWMDPGSHDAVDFMWGGDTAHVAAQYSYLTSVLSIITNIDYGFDQARALFDVIHGYWSTLPEDQRPVLYLHGLSQGALNSQATLPLFDVLEDPPAGAFWAGSPFLSPVWSFIRQSREEGSPEWRPRYGNGSLVRFTNQENVLDDSDFAPWGPIRFVFLHYGSDPIVFFDWGALWTAPDWLSQTPRAPDVPEGMRWFPVVTALQLGLDSMTALTIPRHGHYYVYEDYIDAWATLTDPPGWDEGRAQALKDVFAGRADPW